MTEVTKFPADILNLNGNQDFTKKIINGLEHYCFKFNNMEVLCYVTDKLFTFRSIDLAKILEYTNPPKAVRDHISDEFKMTLSDIVDKLNETIPLKIKLSRNEGATNYNIMGGFYQLIMRSKMKNASEFQKYVCGTILPTLQKTGTFTIPPFKKDLYLSLYNEENITKYISRNVCYIFYIGTYLGTDYFKFGITKDLRRRDIDEHRKDFAYLELLFVKETDNNDVVEKLFKQELKIRNLLINKEINNKNHTELFIIDDKYDFSKVKTIIEKLIDDNPLPALQNKNDEIKQLKTDNKYMSQDYDLKMKQEDTKSTEITEKTKQIEFEFKMKQIEFEFKMKQMEFEVMKLQYQQKNTTVNKIIKIEKVDNTDKIIALDNIIKIDKVDNIDQIIKIDKIDNADGIEYKDRYTEYFATQTEFVEHGGTRLTVLHSLYDNWHRKKYGIRVPHSEFRKWIRENKTTHEGISTNGKSGTGIRNLKVKFDTSYYDEYAKSHIMESAGDIVRMIDVMSSLKRWYAGKKCEIPLEDKETVRIYFEKNIFHEIKRFIHYNNKFFRGWKHFKLI